MNDQCLAGPVDQLPDEHAIQDFLEVLQKHCAECEKNHEYEEAEKARLRLEQLRQHEEERKKEDLRKQQLKERLGVEQAHMQELQEFNDIWDRKSAEFETHAANLQNTLSERHKQEHQAFVDKWRADSDKEMQRQRQSKDLLNLRKIETTLAKLKKYAEAEKTKIQADKLQAQEVGLWKAKRDAKFASTEEQFLHKQHLEMGGLLKRIQSGREEQKTARKTELERLLQRYHNVKTQLETQQRIVQQRVERYPMTPMSSSSLSRPLSASGRNLSAR
mmetsp:Transcript_103631/g.299760  ORF Transcript_103631/g.299760 Transcript_103631/m.299760 type:complete len:275 (-) Transcript_103631:194-1018(-)